MNDDRFDVSADMRLIDLTRKALGVEAPASTWSRSRHDLPHAGVEEEPPEQLGTILIATTDAQPRSGIIPGASITISVAIVNDGSQPGSSMQLSLPLPFDTVYRPGTLFIDGEPGTSADVAGLFGEGVMLSPLAPAQRRTLTVKILVEGGLDDIAIRPHISASGGAIVGPPALSLRRGAAAPVAPAPERPFYEPDAAEGEELAAESPADALPLPVVTVVQPREMPPPPLKEPEPEPPAALPAPVETPAAADAPSGVSAAVRGIGGPILMVTIDRKRITALRALFGARSAGMIAHYLVLNALAATTTLPDEGADTGIADFVNAQEQLLSRALITTRMGKVPVAESVSALLPPFPPPARGRDDIAMLALPPEGELRLVRAFKQTEIDFLARMLANADAPPFLPAAQLFVGLCTNDVAIIDGNERRRVGTLLGSYTALAAGEINRIFLRAKLTRTAEPFRETEPAFDDAARTVLDALAEIIA